MYRNHRPLATCNVSENLFVETLSAHDECTSAITFHVCDFQYSSNRPFGVPTKIVCRL